MAGNWFAFAPVESVYDLLELEELKKSRVRVLLDRYGILFRELMMREPPQFRWSDLFRSLRLMELSGEIVSGYFFDRIAGLQFAHPGTVERIRKRLPEDAVYWLNASDPASCCGLPIPELRKSHPNRTASTHLVYRGIQILLVSSRSGKDLDFRIPPDDPGIADVFCLFDHLLTRAFRPLRKLSIETINGEDAAKSIYAGLFNERYSVNKEPKRLVVTRRIV